MKKQSEETKIKKRIKKAEADLYALHNPPPLPIKPAKHWLGRGHDFGRVYTGYAAIVGPRLNPFNFCVYITIIGGYTVRDKDGKIIDRTAALSIKDPTKEL